MRREIIMPSFIEVRRADGGTTFKPWREVYESHDLQKRVIDESVLAHVKRSGRYFLAAE